MLTVALLVDDDTAALAATLPALAGIASPDRPLLILDQGTCPKGVDLVRKHLARHGGALVALDGHVSIAEASALAQQHSGADYVLVLECADRLNSTGLESFELALQARQPDIAVMTSAWWITHADRPLAGPDHARAMALPTDPSPAAVAGLTPDPRRVIMRGGRTLASDDWRLWLDTVAAAKQILLHKEHVLLGPVPNRSAAKSFHSAVPLLEGTPATDQSEVFAHVLGWLADALTLSPATCASDTIGAAQQMLDTLPEDLRQKACASPAPLGPFLKALATGQDGYSHLSLLASARAEMQMQAVADEYAALRSDLAAALPGPDYLKELHARLRGS